MEWLGLIYIVWFLLIAPVTVQWRFWGPGPFEQRLLIHIWGVPIQPKIGENGELKIESEEWEFFKESLQGLLRLLKAFEWQYVGLRGWIALSTADRTALAWGMAAPLLSAARERLRRGGVPCYFSLLPDFNRTLSRLEGGCILFIRLGKLLALGLVLAWEYRHLRARRKGDRKKWNIPSEA